MKLALKKQNSDNATLPQKLFSALIKARLVSEYSHSGIVIDEELYHVTASHGYQKLSRESWSPEKWDITDVCGDDVRAKQEFEKASTPPDMAVKQALWKLTKGYDWFSLLAFVGPLVRVSWLNYCFELSYQMLTGEKATSRVTPERLLAESLRSKAAKV